MRIIPIRAARRGVTYAATMLGSVLNMSPARRTLIFGSAMHMWSDFFFTLIVPLLPLIRSDPELRLSYTEVGVLRSVFSGATAVIQVPVGYLAEFTGEFWPLIGGNLWVALGLIVVAVMPSFILLVVVSFIAGLGGGTQHPLGSSMVSRAYDDKGRSTAVGTVNFAGDLGKMVAPALGGLLGNWFGWRGAFRIVGIAGAAFMALSTLTRRAVDVGRSRRSGRALVESDERSTNVGGFATLSVVGFLDSMARGGALAFLPFVMDDKGMSVGQISGMLFLLFVGGAAGKFVCGWLGERMGSVQLIWWTKGFTAVLFILTLPASIPALIPLMLVLGVGLNGTSSVLYASVADLVPAGRRARMYGYFYTTNEGGSIVAPILYGRIADLFKLRAAIATMSVMTALILPVSLGLGKYLTEAATAHRKEAA